MIRSARALVFARTGPCLVPIFLKIGIIIFSFIYDKYYLIIN